jgi:oligopeptide transport system substrate-binding protein
MKKFNKIMSLLLIMAMVLSFAACGESDPKATNGTQPTGGSTPATNPAGPVEYVYPYADLVDDYDELSQAVYDDVLGEFYTYYMEAMEEDTDSMRYAKMAIAEAKMLSAGIFLPTISKGGNYAMS